MGSRRWLLAVGIMFISALHAQVIEFESGGLKYKALTRGGVTIMFASLPTHIHEWSILQVAVTNGSPVSWAIKPEDFKYDRADGSALPALAPRTVVDTMIAKASRSDVIKLVSAYEEGLYGNTQLHSTNGYEARRQSALAEVGSTKLKAAAAASAIVLVTTKLMPGQSTDGALFYANQGKSLGPGRLTVNAAGETFEFTLEPEVHGSR
jgi:hypothetical protein